MPTLEENVNRVKAAKTAIGNAITAKGGTVGANDGLEDFANDIGTIPSGGNISGIIDRSITEITIPNDVTTIGSYAFYTCNNLEQIIIPYGVTSIGSFAFGGCRALSEIEISDSVTTIDDYAFAGCTSLASINIPHSVETIASHCFNNAKINMTINIYNRPNSISGAPWAASNPQVNWLLKDRFTSAVNEVSSGTTLTTSVSCTVGDLVIATFVIRGNTYSLSNDWSLIGISDPVGASNQRTGLAYKIATSSTESLTITQDSSARIYTNLVAITGASIGTFSGFTTQSTGSSITMNRPNGLVLWAVSSSLWGTTAPYLLWDISNIDDITAIELPTTTQPRCLTALDQSSVSTVTFRYSPDVSGDASLAAASLTITGIDNFWYYDEPT